MVLLWCGVLPSVAGCCWVPGARCSVLRGAAGCHLVLPGAAGCCPGALIGAGAQRALSRRRRLALGIYRATAWIARAYRTV